MNRRGTKLIREGDYVAEVDVQFSDTPEGWGPYLSLPDARNLDAVRAALKRGDIAAAGAIGRVFRLTPIKAMA